MTLDELKEIVTKIQELLEQHKHSDLKKLYERIDENKPWVHCESSMTRHNYIDLTVGMSMPDGKSLSISLLLNHNTFNNSDFLECSIVRLFREFQGAALDYLNGYVPYFPPKKYNPMGFITLIPKNYQGSHKGAWAKGYCAAIMGEPRRQPYRDRRGCRPTWNRAYANAWLDGYDTYKKRQGTE